jgi:hypothetical protein
MLWMAVGAFAGYGGRGSFPSPDMSRATWSVSLGWWVSGCPD